MGIKTAILDLTTNRNSYYIYTKNEEKLRNINDSHILQIDRFRPYNNTSLTCGSCIINMTDNAVSLNGYSTSLADGTYYDTVMKLEADLEAVAVGDGTEALAQLLADGTWLNYRIRGTEYTPDVAAPSVSETNTQGKAKITNARLGKLVLVKTIAAGSADTATPTDFTYRVTLETDHANGLDLTKYISRTPTTGEIGTITQLNGKTVTNVTSYSAHKIVFDMTLTKDTAEAARTVSTTPNTMTEALIR